MIPSYSIMAFHRWLGRIQKCHGFSIAVLPDSVSGWCFLWIFSATSLSTLFQGHSITYSDASHSYSTFSVSACYCKLANSSLYFGFNAVSPSHSVLEREKSPNLLLIYPNTTCGRKRKKKCSISSLWPLLFTNLVSWRNTGQVSTKNLQGA